MIPAWTMYCILYSYRIWFFVVVVVTLVFGKMGKWNYHYFWEKKPHWNIYMSFCKMIDIFSFKRLVELRPMKPNIIWEENIIHWYFDLEPCSLVAYLSRWTVFTSTVMPLYSFVSLLSISKGHVFIQQIQWLSPFR